MFEYFHKLVTPTKKEQQSRAEVFTPISLVNEMLDKLPIEVWLNPNLKWLDPSNGIGNFPVCIFMRLMDGLKNIIIDEEVRRKHILEEMIYICELDKKNCLLYNILLSHNGKYKLKIFQGDSLTLDVETEWGFEKFNIIVGNPPYQAGQTAKGKRGGGDLLWNKFVRKSLDEWLMEGGYLTFVHPAGWRKPQSERTKYKDLFDLMVKDHHMMYLEIHNSKDGLETFHAGTRYDFYVINKSQNKETIIKDEK